MGNKKLNNRRITIQDVDRKRINIYLPVGTTKAAKERFKSFAKRLIKSQQGNLELSDNDIKYLETLSNVYKEKLKKLGIKFKEENQEEYQLSNLVNVFNKAKNKTDDSEDNKGKYYQHTASNWRFQITPGQSIQSIDFSGPGFCRDHYGITRSCIRPG